MTSTLPAAFTERMQTLLQQDFEAFLESYRKSTSHGLRVNPLKIDPDAFITLSPFELESIPWCPEGFRYPDGARPGKHPYHASGLYYLQEPSAMSAAEALGAEPGERILDLCAAPGGKSTQLAAALQGEGLLIANEIHPQRARALSENLERCAVQNAVVTNETPERLMERFPLFFDRILVDAPCSGEGMFRKLPEAIEEWSPEKVTECHHMQLDILDAAARMLAPGGTLVYSTCTFAPLENEQSIASFLMRHPEFELIPLPHPEWFAPGESAWAKPQTDDLRLTARLWPHLLEGEGHYLAKLRKRSDSAHDQEPPKRKEKRVSKSLPPGRKEAIAAWQKFAVEIIPQTAKRLSEETAFLLFGDQLFYSPAPTLNWDGIKILRVGLHLGTVKKNRFEPSHALALVLSPEEVVGHANFKADDQEVIRYLRGEALLREGESGWTLVTVDGYSIGWGKQADGQLKNHYPKGLRWV